MDNLKKYLNERTFLIATIIVSLIALISCFLIISLLVAAFGFESNPYEAIGMLKKASDLSEISNLNFFILIIVALAYAYKCFYLKDKRKGIKALFIMYCLAIGTLILSYFLALMLANSLTNLILSGDVRSLLVLVAMTILFVALACLLELAALALFLKLYKTHNFEQN